MKLKLGINEVVIFIFLLVLYQFYALKFIYVFIIPGLFVLFAFKRDDFIEALVLSFPLSLICYVYPYFLLTRVGLAINYVIYLLIPGLMLAFLIYKKKLVIEYNRHVNQSSLIFLLIVLGIFYYVYAPYSFKDAIPLTEASNEYRAILDVTNNILTRNVIPRWSNSLYAGNNFFYIYPPLTQVSVSFLSLIPSESFMKCFNMSFTFPLLYLVMVSFLLFRKLGVSIPASTVGAILVLVAPITVGELTYVGNVSSAFTYALYPAALYGFFELFNDKDLRKSLLYGFCLAAFFLTYHFNFYFMIIPAVSLFFACLLFCKNKRDLFINGFYYFGIAFVLIMSWFVTYLFFNSQAPLMFYEGGWDKPLASFTEFLDIISYQGSSDIGKMVHSLGFLFFYVGFIASLLPFRIIKRKLSFKRSDVIVFFFYALAFFLIICELFPFHVLIPLRTKFYTAYRYWFILVPLMAFSIARLMDNINSFKIPKLLTFFGFLLLFSGVISYASTNVNAWLNEKAIVDKSSFQPIYDLINPSLGRAVSFGVFGPAINPAINRWTNASMLFGYNYERYSTLLYFSRLVRPLTEASEDFLHSSVSPVLAYNIFQKAMVKYLIFFTCTENGFKALNITAQYPGYYVLANADCVTALTPANLTSYVENVVLSKTLGNKTALVSDLMNVPGSYRLVFTADELNESYANVVSDVNLSAYVLDSSPLLYRRINPESLVIKGVVGYVLVREPYFPIWHAFQDGKELSIFPSYEGFTIIKSLSISDISLVALPYPSEFIGLIIYLAGIIFCFILFSKK